MSEIAITIENLGKQYRLGQISTGTIAHDLNRWWATTVQGKEDPYLKIGEANLPSTHGVSEYVWALKDINLEVKQGEVLGIIGKNGAGKSTLLKVLSRVTKPTTGSISYRGRIASLLEVGTGFHPEMTGRENIFMNGSIMGMNKSEITRKLDEIVDFAGIERYIDTPTKRYSSGMTVRLGFAIAAHLEPEILVVDEVLAVGDAEFQKKAIGKMQDISKGEGRTVLFVSHNMASIQDLCSRVIVLSNGTSVYDGEVSKAINHYLKTNEVSVGYKEFKHKKKKKAQFKRFEILNSKQEITSQYKSGEEMSFKIFINIIENIRNPILSLRISDINNVNIVTWRSNDLIKSPFNNNTNSDLEIRIISKNLFLLDNIYNISMSFLDGKEILDFKGNFINFELLPSKPSADYYSITRQKTFNSILFSEAIWEVD